MYAGVFSYAWMTLTLRDLFPRASERVFPRFLNMGGARHARRPASGATRTSRGRKALGAAPAPRRNVSVQVPVDNVSRSRPRRAASYTCVEGLRRKGGRFLFLERSKFAASFAADVEPELAAFMADSQVPWGVEALAGAVSKPAWRVKPSWYLVATDDKMIPPPAQRSMAQRAESKVVETAGSHSVYVSKPKVVAALIAQAAREAK